MSLENLTTVNNYVTEKVTSNIVTRTITNPGNSGSNIPPSSPNYSLWQQSNLTTNTYNLTDEDGNDITYADPPLVRAKWSYDGGLTWYDVGTPIPYLFNINIAPSTTQPATNNRASCGIGVSNSQVQIITASGYHGNVAIATNGNATWSGISQDIIVKYATIQSTVDNIVVSSRNTTPVNKILASGTVNFSGSITSARLFELEISIDYEPEFFAIEFDVQNHVPSSSQNIPNGVYTHASYIGYLIDGDASMHQVSVFGGIVSDGSPKLKLSSYVSSGSPFSTNINFNVNYRIIDLGVKQIIDNSNMNNLALSNIANSPSREPTVRTGSGASLINETNPFDGIPFVDYYFSASNDSFYWRNGMKVDGGIYTQLLSVDRNPYSFMYYSDTTISTGFVNGSTGGSPITPTGYPTRYVIYGDYT